MGFEGDGCCVYKDPELIVQVFLRNGGSPDELKAKYGIGYNRHATFPHLIQFKYSMIESPMGERIVQECRGLILNESRGWEVVARPFDKFFNHGEGHAATIDWKTARVQEKLDGSLMIVYYYQQEWHVASSGMPDARGDVNGLNITFAELFWRTYEAQFGTKRFIGNKHVTYMFELTTPFNRVVIPHKEAKLTLLGGRNITTGEELHVEEYDGMQGWPVVRSFPLQSMDEILSTLENMDPLQQEGYVVVDANFNRVKLKHPGYVALAHLRDGMGPRRLLEIVRMGESSEFLLHFPEWTTAFNDVKARFEALVVEMEAAYEKYKDISVQKDFAIAIKEVPFTGALFNLRAGKTKSLRYWLSQMNVKHLADHLKLKDVEF